MNYHEASLGQPVPGTPDLYAPPTKIEVHVDWPDGQRIVVEFAPPLDKATIGCETHWPGEMDPLGLPYLDNLVRGSTEFTLTLNAARVHGWTVRILGEQAAAVARAIAGQVPEIDNHHNAAACPYCGDQIQRVQRPLDRVRAEVSAHEARHDCVAHQEGQACCVDTVIAGLVSR